jgi:hypothetical protein
MEEGEEKGRKIKEERKINRQGEGGFSGAGHALLAV